MTIDHRLQMEPVAAAKVPRRALLLANTNASRVSEHLPAALEQFKAHGLELIVHSPSKNSASLADLILQHRHEIDCVIVGGGDGTLNSIADALIQTDLPLGILPLGTANDLARTLNLPQQIDQACRVIIAGKLRRIDLGWVNGKHFFNAASLGLSSQISRQLNKTVKRRWGILAYPFTALKVLWQMRPFHAEIIAEQNRWHVKTVQITIGNGRFFGGGMTVDEHATIDDQQLNLYSIEVQRWWQLPALFWSLRRGRLEPVSQVRTLQGQYFEIRTRRQRWINTDGELVVSTPATFRNVPLAVAVYCP